MILLLAGTGDSRELAAALTGAGYRVLASAATSYGGDLLRSLPGLLVRQGELNETEMGDLLRQRGIDCVIDATHPFAAGVSTTAIKAARANGVPYLRWERAATPLPENPLVIRVKDWAEAAGRVAGLAPVNAFLAVGVKPLVHFIGNPILQSCRFTVRVLPVPDSVATCLELGLRPDQIIAMQGPGSEQLNRILLEEKQSQLLVVKESGPEGGTRVKLAAALGLGIPVIIVERPVVSGAFETARCLDEVYKWLEHKTGT